MEQVEEKLLGWTIAAVAAFALFLFAAKPYIPLLAQAIDKVASAADRTAEALRQWSKARRSTTDQVVRMNDELRHDLKLARAELKISRETEQRLTTQLAETRMAQSSAEDRAKQCESRLAATHGRMEDLERAIESGGKAEHRALPRVHRPERGEEHTGAHRSPKLKEPKL